ncbi:hypothetical protein M9Y10_038858 [Tritrichomonas musculus]|uniref:Uncharacterized protein n=1 Tax=Tritrichomonas musculus TaxID=1915356 RepID=A0ABR2K9L4_9EUKA
MNYLNNDSIDLRRPLRESDSKLCITPEIIEQIPFYLAHFEVAENRDILYSILASLKTPEPYGIHLYLYQIVFGEGNSNISTQHKLLDSTAQDFLNVSGSLPSFPFLLFSNEECITQLLNFLVPPINESKFVCATKFICSIFDHNHQRNFIPLSIYESIFQLICSNLNLTLILSSILLYSEELPKDIFPLIFPILEKHLQQRDLFVARGAMFILFELQRAKIPFDLGLIIECENKFIDSIDPEIIYELLLLMKNAPEPPYQCLERILKLVDSKNPKLMKEALSILSIFGHDWNDDQKDLISNSLISLFNRSPLENNNVAFIMMTVEVLITIDRLPINNINFFTKVIEMIDVWDNYSSVLLAIYTMLVKTNSVSPTTAEEMLVIIKSSLSFELLVLDNNAEVANLAQEILKIDSFNEDR